MNRLYCTLAALFLAFAAMATAGHSVIHAGAGAEQCMLCTSHADSQGACPAASGPVPVDPGLQAAPETASVIRPARRSDYSPQPRAPPHIS